MTGLAGHVSRLLVADAALRGAGVVDVAGEQVDRDTFRRVGRRVERQDARHPNSPSSTMHLIMKSVLFLLSQSLHRGAVWMTRRLPQSN